MDRIFKGNGLVQMKPEEMGQAAGVLLVGKPSPMHESKDRQKKAQTPQIRRWQVSKQGNLHRNLFWVVTREFISTPTAKS